MTASSGEKVCLVCYCSFPSTTSNACQKREI